MQSILKACESQTRTTFQAGHTLIREGEPGGRLIVLIEGEVTVRRGDIEVARVTEAGALLGEMSALLDKPCSATVEARTDVTVAVIEDVTCSPDCPRSEVKSVRGLVLA